MTAPDLLLAFPEYRAPARRLADAAGTELAEVEVHRFPDGESRLRLPGALPPRVGLVRSLDDPNPKLVELLLAAETARAQGARELTLVVPYLCYMRQDIAFHPGEAVSQRIVGRFLGGLVDRLITVDPHLHRTPRLADVTPGAEAVVLSATAPMADFLRGAAADPVLVGPDVESGQWVQALAERVGCEFVVAAKERRGDREVHVRLPDRDLAGREVVIVDDIVSTGRSLVAAAAAARERGASRVAALVTHGLLAGDAPAALAAGGIDELWSTDSVPGDTARVHLAGLLAAAR